MKTVLTIFFILLLVKINGQNDIDFHLNKAQKEIDEEIKTREKSLKNGHFVRRKYKKLKPSG